MVSRSVLVTVLILGIISSQFAVQAQTSEGELISQVVSKLLSLWHSDTVEFVGQTCQYSYKPTVRKFKLKYKGKFWCPGLTSISGRSLTSSRSGAVEHAIKDFVKQAVKANVVEKKDVGSWLQN